MNQKGFAHILIILVVLGAFVSAMFASYKVYEYYVTSGQVAGASSNKAPTLKLVTSIPRNSAVSTPEIVLNTNMDGKVTYSGVCVGNLREVKTGRNTIRFSELPTGTYQNCKVKVTTPSGKNSTVTIAKFIIIAEAKPLPAPTPTPTLAAAPVPSSAKISTATVETITEITLTPTPVPTGTPTPTTSPTPSPTPTPTPTPSPTIAAAPSYFSGLSSVMTYPANAVFSFDSSLSTNSYQIDVSTYADMSWDVYMSFGSGNSNVITVTDPSKWDKYTCGKTLYWRVRTLDGKTSQANPGIKATTVQCPSPTPTPINSMGFANLTAGLLQNSANFSFTKTVSSTMYYIDLSTVSDMSTDVYLSFGQSTSSPIQVTNPTKWDKYTCGKTLYWRVRAQNALTSVVDQGVQKATVACATPTPTPTPTATPTPIPVPPADTSTYTKKVLLVIYNPIIEAQQNKKLTAVKGWRDPDALTATFMNSMRSVSKGMVNYTIAERIEYDAFPTKTDGFTYTDSSYLSCASGGSCHNPDLSNYQKMIQDSGACAKRNAGTIDELWIWGGPWFGFYESNLAGPNAYWYNSSPTTGTTCTKLLPVMGFSYERSEEEMFEDFGHRFESAMVRVYGTWLVNEYTPWNKFSLLNKDMPGKGGCGNSHSGVNGNGGYDRTNTSTVTSSCEDFAQNFPYLRGTTSQISCSAWGCNTLNYFKWYFGHIPNKSGTNGTKLNNWWRYIINPDEPNTYR